VGVSRFRLRGRRFTLASVPRYLVESYVARSPTAADDARQRALRTAEVGSGVEYVHTTFVPGDETVLHIFDAPSQETLDEAGRRAGLEFDRIVEVVDDWQADERRGR
jgi:uncharacterized protein DUF4242